MIVVDTSGVLAAVDQRQEQHREVVAALGSPHPRLLLSPFVLAELDYLLATRVGRAAQRTLLERVVTGALALEPFDADAVRAAMRILDRYTDLDIGLADASIVVLAERYGINDVLTLDQRHFRVLEGPAGEPFRLLPADA